jgi:SEC-C motif-containing protein
VKEAFDRESIPGYVMEFKHFQEDLAWALDHPDTPHRDINGDYSLWSDTVGELSRWPRFSKTKVEARKGLQDEPAKSTWWGEPAINAYRDVGRNDPCPCGSGKKFKKCCLAKAA